MIRNILMIAVPVIAGVLALGVLVTAWPVRGS